MQSVSDNQVKAKLDEFIRKYYTNELLRGSIYFVTLWGIFFISIAIMDYFGQFNASGRTVLWWTFITLSLGIISKLIVLPIIKLQRLTKVISYQEAATIVGLHFNQIGDKILNVLQLENQADAQRDNSLILAAIQQKAVELKPFSFGNAIDLSQNKRYLKLLLIPAAILLLLQVTFPELIYKSAVRLINHNTEYVPESPFTFKLENKILKAVQFSDYELQISVNGKILPSEVSIVSKGYKYKMDKGSKTSFSYVFNNIQSNTEFYLEAGDVRSSNYIIQVMPKPTLTQFSIKLNYPSHTSKPAETLQNIGDLNIPEGTKVSWQIFADNANAVNMFFKPLSGNDTAYEAKRVSEKEYSFSCVIFKDNNYGINASSHDVPPNKEAVYSIKVIADAYPTINVSEKKDSASLKHTNFYGMIKDDYGFTSLKLVYRKISSNDSIVTEATFKEINIPISKSLTQSSFYYYWDLNTINIAAGDNLEYYFVVADNDIVNGPKKTRSDKALMNVPSLSELSDSKDKANDQLKDELSSAIKDAKKLQKELNAFSKKLMEKKELSWEEKKKMEELLSLQKELEKKINNIQQQSEENNKKQSEFTPPSDELAEKQKQLEDLFEKLMTDEMKKMFQEMQELLSKTDKQKTQDMIDKMKLSTKDLEKELDRNLELFKQLEFEQKFKETQEQLSDLAKQQEELSEKTKEDKKGENKEENLKKQEELNKEFEKVKEDLADLQKKNSELERPNEMKDSKEKQEDISKDMKNSSEQMKEGKNSNASKSQKSASEKMKEVAEEMKKEQEEMEEEAAAEDYEAMRQIMENLVQLSFEQENIIKELKSTDINDPKYVKIGQRQKKIKDDSKMIEDSLFALSKRQPKIESTVNKEISAINDNMDKAIAHIQERQTAMANSRQQFAMTSLNNLALIFSESMQQMQQEMKKKSKSGSGGSCKKPGKGSGGKPSAATMRQMQQQLAEQLKRMKEGMDKGKGQKPGQKPGDMPGAGGMPSSQEFAQMAAQQEALRQALQDGMKEGMGQEGKQGEKSGGSGGNAKELREIAKKMEQTETDLVNKTITNETIKRQQDILTRLLEAEKAEKEREQDEKRKSNEAKNQFLGNPEPFLEYKRLKEKETELLQTVSPSLKPFYKTKVNEYFNGLNTSDK